jgi:nicotinic acid mononucleotide adenylyltransferase
MRDFFNRLNESSWKGFITEVGIGVGFTYDLLNTPGASKTLLKMECPYQKRHSAQKTRRVTLEWVKKAAEESLHRGYEQYAANSEPMNQYFGLAISGAHYEDRESHLWVYLARSGADTDAWMHVSFLERDRGYASIRVSKIVSWFLDQVFFSESDWKKAIETVDYTCYIDVLYAPDVSDVDRLNLLRPGNPLVYEDGKFHRVVDYVRKYDTVYSGSFNPIHRAHLENAGDALLELSQLNCRKSKISAEDMLHRIKMIDLCHYPVLLTAYPMFVDKHGLLQSLDKKKYTYIVGADTWNAFVNPHQYISNGQMLKYVLQDAHFKIFARPGVKILENELTQHISHDIVSSEGSNMSSTVIRGGDHTGLVSEVSEYVRQHGLYGTGA